MTVHRPLIPVVPAQGITGLQTVPSRIDCIAPHVRSMATPAGTASATPLYINAKS